MGLFTPRKSRATRRAEARAIKAKAKLEARLAAKNDARRIKADAKRQTAVAKATLKAQRESDNDVMFSTVDVARFGLRASLGVELDDRKRTKWRKLLYE